MWSRREVRHISYLVAIAFIVSHLAPPAPVRCSEHTVVPYVNMNKTIRDQMRKHKFLNVMMNRLLQINDFPRNSSASNGPSRGIFTLRSHENTQLLGNLTQSHLLYNISGVDKSIPHKVLVPIGDRSTFAPANLVYSESIDKNVLTFRFKSNTVRNNTLVNRINLWLYVWTEENKGKSLSSLNSPASSSPKTRDLNSDDRRDRHQGKRIKIRVFLSDANGLRGQRIAELKTRIEASSWGKLGLPVSLINTLADSDTLHLRVDCKRCTRKTQVVLPGSNDSKRCRKRQRLRKKKKMKETKMQRWRKHCLNHENMDYKMIPFIVIEEKSRNARGRFKRASDAKVHCHTTEMKCHNNTKYDERGFIRTNALSSLAPRQCCKPFKMFVDFADIGFDQLIVYPSGFEFVTCIDSSTETSASLLTQARDKLERVIHLASKKVRNNQKKSSLGTSLTSHALLSSYTDRKHNKRHLQQLLHNHHRHMRRDNRRKRKRNMLETSFGGCQPVESNNLVILHFTPEHKLAQLELPRFVVTRCGCKGHLTLNKNSTFL